ncbi:transient-receptor-potential-like protein [Liolophura sinensis]|uniref:transient-receptor-potential-like protein n=1 Tax=Liolophura sinensis TaxID=3198878 RepID=UPI003158BC26
MNYNSRRHFRHSSKTSCRPIPIPLEPLKQGEYMDPKERLFLEAAEKGDKHSMIRCLQGPNPVNVNCTNMLGRSAIQIAVDNENIEIVEVLLKQDGVKIGDALLYAIREGVYRIVEMLIDHPSISRSMLGSDWSRTKPSGEESNDYSPDISPVILAAHCNQFEILQLLLTRGANIEKPHELSCSCKKCQEQVHEDSLRHSLLRINTYRALASPAWISLTSSDPILSAFKLSWELEKLALRENEFKDTYMELSDQCKRYACDLLDQCRSSEEVIAVLNKEIESEDDSDYDEDSVDRDDKLTLARLKLALKYEQRQFVAHPHCQQLLTSIWYEGLPGWRKRNGFTKFLMCIGLIVLQPFMAVYYLIFPRSKIGQLLRSPFMKFLYHSASFGVFLSLLVFVSMDVSNQKGRDRLRGPPPSQLEWLIVFWVTGFIWAECKQVWDEGLKAYARQWWNWLDFIMLSLYLAAFSCRISAFFQISSGRFGPENMERNCWPHTDPVLISEGLFALANVFSFARIIYLFQANQHLGPLQISLGCMLIDIAKFLFIFFLVLTSFACGMNQLYWYYGLSENNQSGAFNSLLMSYRTLFWSLFSLTQLKDIKNDEGGQPYTEIIGELMFMIYHAMGIIVLINMLIAMMSNSFQDIENHADREWKFARSKLWMGYFDEGCTLPPPFNLIISPKSVYYFLRSCKAILCHCCRWRRRSSQMRRKSTEGTIKFRASVSPDDNTIFKTSESGKTTNDRPTYNGEPCGVTYQPDTPLYQDVMRRLVSRFIHQWKKQLRQDGVNEDDLLEIKQDISSLRYELREDRKRETQRTVGHMDTLRQDIAHTFRPSPSNSPLLGNSNKLAHTSPNSSMNLSSSLLTPQELEYIRHDIVKTVRHEVREAVRDALSQSREPRNALLPPPPLTMLPPINSELYHTHLYTQL